MRTKIVYVLVSSEQDIYYEQALLSIWSARYWNPQSVIVLVTDDRTSDRLKQAASPLLSMIDECVVVNYPSAMSGRLRSRELKTTLRQRVDGDYLFVDADTIICSSLAEIDSFDGEMGAVLDGHQLLDRTFHHHLVQAEGCLGFTAVDGTPYYNSGVMFVKDSEATHTFYQAWHELYERLQQQGHFFDQPSLFAICQQYPIVKELDGAFNCQLFLGGIPYLGDAKIIHTFNDLGLAGYGNPSPGQVYDASAPRQFYYPASTNFLLKIKEQGGLMAEDETIVVGAKRQFYGEYQLLIGQNLAYYHSALFHVYNKHPRLFKLLDKVGRLINRYL